MSEVRGFYNLSRRFNFVGYHTKLRKHEMHNFKHTIGTVFETPVECVLFYVCILINCYVGLWRSSPNKVLKVHLKYVFWTLRIG